MGIASERAHPWRHRMVGQAFGAVVWILRIAPDRLAYGLADLLVPILVLVTWLTRRRSTR